MEREFIAEFLIHEVTTTVAYIAKPAIAIRLMEFPTLIVDGRSEERVVFGKGKACKFVMDPEVLSGALRKLPLYVMLMDVYAPNIKMLATAALDLSLFTESPFPVRTEFRRSRIDLYDPVRNPVARVDLSISFMTVPEKRTEIEATPTDTIFKTITEEDVRRSTPAPQMMSTAVGTDTVQQVAPQKVTFSKGTMTQESEAAPRSVQTETSVFNQVFQPPPMFFSKPSKYTPRETPPELPLPVRPQPQYRAPAREGMLEDLITELISLKERSKVQQQVSYPPLMQFEQRSQTPIVLTTQKVAQVDILVPPHFDQSPIDTARSKESIRQVKMSVDEYSDDFEEEKSSSMRTSQSSEQTVKCYLCSEWIKMSEAAAHAKKCKRSRLKESISLSPRSSIEEQIDASHVSKGAEKSLSQTSMIQEYEEDFEEASSSQK